MFDKIVVVDQTGMNDWAKQRLRELSLCAEFYDDFPQEQEEIIHRIKDADCLMVSYCTPITKEILNACPKLRYIGMCCSLYDDKSANVDVEYARSRGITVTGIFDYGDQGVVEMGVSALVWLLHGFGGKRWRARPVELDGLKVGILGLGATGFKLAKALQFFGSEIYYANRRIRDDAQALGMQHLPLDQMLQTVDVLTTQLPKGTILLGEKEFKQFGSGKILINTSIGPTFSTKALQQWLDDPTNYYICDEVGAGAYTKQLAGRENFLYLEGCAGSSEQCTKRLSEKSIANVEAFLKK